MNPMNPKVDGYIRKARRWREELKAFRAILLDTALTEKVKWRAPCYTFQDKNVVIIQAFKDYCALMFFKGALLRDAKGVLTQPGENTQAARQLRFTSLQDLINAKAIVKAYVEEAIAVERAGLKVELKKTAEADIPEELQAKLEESPALKTAFAALTPGRQRAYLLHFSAPKQSKTRASRVEKCMPRILNGKGLNDE